MKPRVAFLAGALTFAILSVLQNPASAGDYWRRDLRPGQGVLNMMFLDKDMGGDFLPASFVSSLRPTFAAVLPSCDEFPSEDTCVVSLASSSDGGQWNAAKFLGAEEPVKEVGTDYDQTGRSAPVKSVSWPSNLTDNRPAAGWLPIYSASSARHAGGDHYAVAATFNGQRSGQGFRDLQLDLQIYPLVISPGSCDGPVNFPGKCVTKHEFPSGIKFKVEIRLGGLLRAIPAWFQGRLIDQQIAFDERAGTITLSGEPALIPIAEANVPADKISQVNLVKPGGQPYSASDQIPSFYTDSSRTFAVSQFVKYLPFMKDAAVASARAWRVGSLEATSILANQKFGTCVTPGKGLIGLMSTNATVYDAGPPEWDSRNLTLSYRVAAPHYDETLKVNSGRYEMTVRSDVARCLWGQDLRAARAEISVVDQANAQPKVATTTFNERDGWVNFRAYGFEYSANQISIRLKPVPKPLVVPNKSSITCVKGRLTKKVTAVKPTCPTGYRKK